MESLRSLEPDLVIAMFYGGNDLKNVMPLERYFHSRGSPRAPVELVPEGTDPGPIGESLDFAELGQLAYLHSNPLDERIAVGTCASIAPRDAPAVRGARARFVCVYLPPPLCAQPTVFAEVRAAVEDRLRSREMDVELSDRMADEWIALLREHGLEVLDLRAQFQSAERSLLAGGWHTNLRGNALLASTFRQELEARGF